MTIHRNPLYRCDMCATVNEWSKDWCSLTTTVTTGYNGIEHAFHLCSNACLIQFRALSRKERRELYRDIMKFAMTPGKNT